MEVKMKKLMTIAAAGLLLAGIGTVQAHAAETTGSTGTTTMQEGLKNGLKKGMKNGKKNGDKK